MHIAFVTFGDFNSHATLKRATGMAGALMRKGHKVTLLLEDAESNHEKVKLECNGANVVWHQRGKTALNERHQKSQSLILLQPDVVWVCGVGPRNWVKRPSEPCIMLADHSELFSALDNGCVYRFRYWLTEWLSCLSFDGHICASRYLESFYKRRLTHLHKCTPVHYSPYAYDAPAENLDQNKSPWDLVDKKCIFYLGSFRESYDMWTMLHALEALVQQRQDCIAILGGRGPDEAIAKEWLDNSGLSDRIRMVGYIPETEMSVAMRRADVFLCPLQDSRQDWARCPSKLFMYYPYGKPIVTCRIGEAKELLEDSGYYYLPGDSQSMKSQIENALDAKQVTCQRDQGSHSWEARTEEFLKWFKQNYEYAI